MPPFEPEQGCLPRAASACAVKRIPETRRKINFLISISVIYFVTLGLSNPKAINRFVRKTCNDSKQKNNDSFFSTRYGRSAKIRLKKVVSSKHCPGRDKAPSGVKVQLFTGPDRINNRPRGVTNPPLWNGRLHTPGHTLTIQEYRHKFYSPVVDTQEDSCNLKSPAIN